MKRRPDRRAARMPRTVSTGALRIARAVGGRVTDIWTLPTGHVGHTLVDGRRAVTTTTIARIAGVEVEAVEAARIALGIAQLEWVDLDGSRRAGWRTDDMASMIIASALPAAAVPVARGIWSLLTSLPIEVAP